MCALSLSPSLSLCRTCDEATKFVVAVQSAVHTGSSTLNTHDFKSRAGVDVDIRPIRARFLTCACFVREERVVRGFFLVRFFLGCCDKKI